MTSHDSIRRNSFRKQFFYICDDTYLFKVSSNGLIRRYVVNEEARRVMWHYHNLNYGGHHNGERGTEEKKLKCGFW